MFRVGIDLGGTKIEGIVLNENGKELFRKRVPTEQVHGYRHIMNNIKTLYDDMISSINNKDHTFGIGTPGAISQKTGLLNLSNTVCMNGKPLKKDLEILLCRKIAIQNDANCFAMAEAIMGAGKGKNMVFGVIMGTGCGGGIIYKGEVITGIQALAGEWGHMSIDPDGPLCFCGRHGCVETFISGGGLQKLYHKRYREKRPLKQIEDDYYNGEKKAVEFMKIFFNNFGRAMANLITILDPDIVVLGGGVSNFDAIYTEGVKETEKQFSKDRLETEIVKHQIGDSSGVIGAALIGIA